MLYGAIKKGEAKIKRIHLKKARENHNMTQADVAKYLGMQTNAYQAIELGKHGTSEKKWLKLYRLFDCKVPLNELMEMNNSLPVEEK